MLKKLGKTDVKGIFRWEVYVRTKEKQIHTVIRMTEADAQKFYADLLEAKSRQKQSLQFSVPLARMRLSEACAKYEQEIMLMKREERHVTDILLSLRMFREVLGEDFPVPEIRGEHVRKWREKRQNTALKDKFHRGTMPGPRTINKSLTHITTFLKYCCQNEWLEFNPAQYVQKIKHVKPAMKILSWKAFCDFADRAWKEERAFALLVEILGESGARIEEVLTAKVGDVNIFRKTWTKTVKPGKQLVLDAGPWILHAATGKDAKHWLCPQSDAKDAKPFTYAMAHKRFGWYASGTFTAHWVRHGRACWDLIDGKTVHDVKEKLGHASVTTTEIYLKAYKQLQREEEAGTKHVRDVAVCSKVAEIGGDSMQLNALRVVPSKPANPEDIEELARFHRHSGP